MLTRTKITIKNNSTYESAVEPNYQLWLLLKFRIKEILKFVAYSSSRKCRNKLNFCRNYIN